jgi:hypothetical protein
MSTRFTGGMAIDLLAIFGTPTLILTASVVFAVFEGWFS